VAAAEKKAMTTNTNNHLCAVCGRELEATTITHEVKRGTHMYLFQNVPAKVCTACQEIWIDEEVLQVIDQLIESGMPVRTVETPMYDFPRAVAPAR
jgi:YgiT-type zinc finger domain-containing protein